MESGIDFPYCGVGLKVQWTGVGKGFRVGNVLMDQHTLEKPDDVLQSLGIL